MAPSAITSTIEEYGSLSLKTDYPLLEKTVSHHQSTHNGEATAKQMIGHALQKRVANIDEDTCDAGDEDAFFVADMGEVYRQHLRWKKNLKRVKPHYGQSRRLTHYIA